MQKQNIALRRSVERKVPGYVRVIVALLYAATLSASDNSSFLRSS